jgi:hypothetical protein
VCTGMAEALQVRHQLAFVESLAFGHCEERETLKGGDIQGANDKTLHKTLRKYGWRS